MLDQHSAVTCVYYYEEMSQIQCYFLYSLVKVAKVREKKAEQVNETFAGDGDNDVSDDEQHDGDSTAVKQRGRHAGEQEYEGEEEERQEIGGM